MRCNCLVLLSNSKRMHECFQNLKWLANLRWTLFRLVSYMQLCLNVINKITPVCFLNYCLIFGTSFKRERLPTPNNRTKQWVLSYQSDISCSWCEREEQEKLKATTTTQTENREDYYKVNYANDNGCSDNDSDDVTLVAVVVMVLEVVIVVIADFCWYWW